MVDLCPEKEYSKLNWRCRRGMLELDIILLPFLEYKYNVMSLDYKAQFKKLLELSDPKLYQILVNKAKINDMELCGIIGVIKEFMCNDFKMVQR